MSNVAEGFDRGGRKEFHQFLSIAKGSAAEVRSLIHVAFDAKMISTDQYGELVQLSQEVARIIAGLRRAVAAQTDNRKRKG
jgi:four helix bundle protein